MAKRQWVDLVADQLRDAFLMKMLPEGFKIKAAKGERGKYKVASENGYGNEWGSPMTAAEIFNQHRSQLIVPADKNFARALERMGGFDNLENFFNSSGKGNLKYISGLFPEEKFGDLQGKGSANQPAEINGDTNIPQAPAEYTDYKDRTPPPAQRGPIVDVVDRQDAITPDIRAKQEYPNLPANERTPRIPGLDERTPLDTGEPQDAQEQFSSGFNKGMGKPLVNPFGQRTRRY